MEERSYIEYTQRWLLDFVIGHNLCPFARQPFVQNRIAYRLCLEQDTELALQAFWALLEELLEKDETEISNALFILPQGLDDFEDYLDFYDLAEQLIETQDLEGDFQLAHFHPDFCFEGHEPDDPSNFVNLSPWPMIHVLRVDEVSEAIDSHSDIHRIPKDNTDKLEALGLPALLRQLSQYRP